MRVNGVDARQMMQDERMQIRKTAEAFGRISKHSDFPFLMEYFNQRGTELMQQLVAPSAGADGMSIALSAERIKGALQEIQRFPQYFAAIMKADADNRKSERDPGDEAAPLTRPPRSEADFVPSPPQSGQNQGE